MRAIIALGLRAEPATACALADCALRHPIDVVEGLEVLRRLRDWPETAARDAALIRLSAHPSRLVRKAAERAAEECRRHDPQARVATERRA